MELDRIIGFRISLARKERKMKQADIIDEFFPTREDYKPKFGL